jgi:hypothetical protein
MNLSDYSDPEIVLSRAKLYFGEDVILKKSTRKTKKYMIFDPNNNKFVHFGQMGYKDFTKYIQLFNQEIANEHRRRYLRRAYFNKGDWRTNKYSPNYLSMLLLWQYIPGYYKYQLYNPENPLFQINQ